MKRIIIAMTALAIATVALAQGAWQRTSGQNLSFEMPGKPVYTTENTPLGGGVAAFHQYMVDEGSGKRVFIVQTTIYPAGLKLPDVKESLQITADNEAKDMTGGKWSSFRAVTSNNLPATDGTGMKDKIEIRILNVLRGQQIVTLTFGGPPGQANSPDATRFIESLKLQ